MAGFCILHVDDDENIRVLTALAFTLSGGGEVRSAASGAEALEVLAAGLEPDLILLDVMMPDMDGPAVLARVRELPDHRNTPVIFMTAQTQDHERAGLMALGASGVVIKPFDPMTLGQQVRALMEERAGD
ncbi:MAG: response regulator [Caulobacterales bacterium]|nr:response regulator [Caulobacterales bacterium]